MRKITKNTVLQEVRQSNKSDVGNPPAHTPQHAGGLASARAEQAAQESRHEGEKKLQSQHLFKCYYTYRERFSFQAPVLIMQQMFDDPSENSMNIYASSFVEC